MKNEWVKLPNNTWVYYDNDGKQVNNWYRVESIWYYFKDSIMQTGWINDNGTWYYMQEVSDSKLRLIKGQLITGWLFNSGAWYYLAEKTVGTNEMGSLQLGWIHDGSKWYYAVPESNASIGEYKGQILINTTRKIEGTNYTFNGSGAWQDNSNTGYVSNALIDFVKSFEGFSATPYQDEVNVWTLGYGMTGDEIEGLNYVTEEQATTMLKDWIDRKYAPVIKSALNNKGVSLSQNQFDALVSMAYNVGTAGVIGSTLFKNICAGVRDSGTITSNFQAWSYAGGVKYEGLYRRRTKEAKIFLNGDYTGNV